jgi:hypothetical protein
VLSCHQMPPKSSAAAEKREREREKAARKAAKGGPREENDEVEEKVDENEDEEEEEEEFDGPDPRIAQLKAYVGAGHSPEECAAELERLGGVDAIVCGAMLTGRSGEDFAKAHFVVSITLDQGGKLTEEIVQNKALLKACCASSPEAQIGFLTAVELLVVKDKRNGIKVFDKICKTVWECDVVEEDQFKVWRAQETALQKYYPEFELGDAINIRESADKFLEWLEEGEDDE